MRIPKSPPDRRFCTLDGMRGIAALLVAVYHFQERQNLDHVGGYLAVDLFFVLSGFVIALNYTARLSDGLPLRSFLKLRVARLYPVYAFGLILGIARQLLAHALGDARAMDWLLLASAAAFGFVMLPSPMHSQLFPLNGPSWSLFFEMAINLIFAAGLWRVRSRAIFAMALLSGLLMIQTIGPPYYFNAGWAWDSFVAGLARTIFSFSAGVLIFRYVSAKESKETWGVLVPLFLMSLLISYDASGPYQKPFELAAVLLAFPSLLALGLLAEPPRRLRRILSFLGDLSYPIYAIHWPLLPLIVPLILKLKMGFWPSAGVYLAVTIALGYATFRLVDLPLSSWLRRRLKSASMARNSPAALSAT